jgi:ATP-dependent helicase/nuclease subunit A
LPKDDLNLACLLKSPFFLISEEELLEICLKKNQDKSSLYDAISNDEIKNTLQSFIEKSRQLNCFEFFYYLLRQSNFDKNFIAYFGNQALQIIDKFFEIVMNFNQSTSPNLQQFLEFIEVIDPEIILNETANNSVKITTIHSSKGLQSPVIIVPDCCYNPRRSPSNKDGIFWIDNLPIWCSKKSDENALIKEYREKRFVENSEEYLRLLYVAMTRAEDELYIGGFGNDSTPDCWYEIIKNSLPQNILSEFEELNEVKKPEKFKTKSLDKNSLGNQSLGKKEQRLSQVNHGTIKGKLIHKILEIFGKNYTADKIWLKDLAQNIIEKEELFSQKEKSDILIQANDFLDSELFNQIFNGEIKCEFEIVNNGNLQRIDLLTIKENEIMIIDYKSDESLSDEVLIDYKFQLDSYKKAVEKIYPNKNISTAILWTKNLELRKILS